MLTVVMQTVISSYRTVPEKFRYAWLQTPTDERVLRCDTHA